jgi:hypothetical protein
MQHGEKTLLGSGQFQPAAAGNGKIISRRIDRRAEVHINWREGHYGELRSQEAAKTGGSFAFLFN